MNWHSLLRFDKIDDSFITGKAVLPQYQTLGAELNPFRFIGALRDVGSLTPLVIYGNDPISFAFQEVYSAGDAGS